VAGAGNYISQGRIIVAKLPGTQRGSGKARWYLVISETFDNEKGKPLGCMGISTQFSDEDFRIKIPDNPDDPTAENPTNLREPCAVICNWPAWVKAEFIINDDFGYLPRAEFEALMDFIDSKS
jgi:hypothetical protein